MRQVNASSSNFAAKLESSTPMARLALQTSGLYVCLFHFLQIRFSILQFIKVYLSAARSLHIEQGFPDPLLNCLRLQRVLRGVKRSQGSPAAQRCPITDSLLLGHSSGVGPQVFRSLRLLGSLHAGLFWFSPCC